MSRRHQPLNAHHAATIAEHARRMRYAPSPSEQLLWSQLSGSRLGVAFRGQYVIGTFIADFAAPSCRLIVEVDGDYHLTRERADASRDAKLRRLGWRVLRFPSVLRDIPAVLSLIRHALTDSEL